MLRTLGGLHLDGASRQQAGPLVLLSYLALEGPQERRSVQELFFPGHADPAGRLRMLLHRLRQVAPAALKVAGTRLETSLSSDAAKLLQAAERQRSGQVLSLYQGRFLDGVRLPGDQELEEWVFSTRERLAARVRACHLAEAGAAAGRGELGLALTHAERAYLLPGAPEPEQSEATLLALLLTATGSAFAADARTEARHLNTELPQQAAEALSALLSPTAGSVKVVQTPIEAGSAAQIAFTPPISQLLPPDAGLPTLLGREAELAQIGACFAAGARLITLLGPGGMGKTLLARHALNQLAGQTPLNPGLMVDLSALQDAPLVLSVISAAVQARTASLEDVAQALRGYGLLLLDNFEQVLPAASEVGRLLELAPELCVLVTSRERLHLAQEYVLPLAGLGVMPDLRQPGAARSANVQPANVQPALWSDAARLFVRRATRAHLGFVPGDHQEGTEQVCTLLRGVPLLIELASAWVSTLSPADIAAQLDEGKLHGAELSAPDLDLLSTREQNVPARHASARTVLEASWRLLSAAEQAQLSKLAVFLSDFTVKAARQVTGATLSMLANLTDKSWLGVGSVGLAGAAGSSAGTTGRLSWHPLARAFVREMKPQWQEMLPAHAHFFAQSLDAARFQSENVADLLGEWPDTAQATRTLARSPEDWPTLTRLAREVPVWTDQVGNYASVAGLIGRIFDSMPPDASPRAQLLRARAFMHQRMHKLQAAATDYRAAADLLIESGDLQEVLEGLDALAQMHKQTGEYAQAEQVWRDLLRRLESLDLPLRQAYVLHHLAVNAWIAGKLPEAEAWIRQSIGVRLTLSPGPNLVLAYSTLGSTLARLGRRAEAHQALTEGLRLAHQIRAVAPLADLLNVMALNLLELDRAGEAVLLCVEALRLDQIEQPSARAEMLDTLALCYAGAGQEQLARQALAQSVRITDRLEDVQNLLHRVFTYTVVAKASLTPPERTAILHWLWSHEQANAALKDTVFKEMSAEIQPANILPVLDQDLISQTAQRLCQYKPGQPTLVAPAVR